MTIVVYAMNVVRLKLNRELFVFVTAVEADGNNHADERQFRDDATARKTGRTSKTPPGAKRRSVISSVLQSIGKQLPTFTRWRLGVAFSVSFDEDRLFANAAFNAQRAARLPLPP